MAALNTIRRVTIYADAALETMILEGILKSGATGYTVLECRGKGKHEVIEDPFRGISRVRIEVLAQPPVAEAILEWVGHPQFRRRAVAACMETVDVLADDAY